MRLLFFMILSYSFLSAGGVLDVDWGSIDKSQQKSTATYPSVLREGIKNVRLPVYLTKNHAYDKNMVVVADANFYSISVEIEGAFLLFEGDKTFQVSVNHANPEFQKIVQNLVPVKYEESEGMMMAEFSKHGVNYSITIECESPKKDKRCTQTTLIESLYNGLTMVGGRP